MMYLVVQAIAVRYCAFAGTAWLSSWWFAWSPVVAHGNHRGNPQHPIGDPAGTRWRSRQLT